MKQLSRILIIVLFLITSLGISPGLASPDIPPSCNKVINSDFEDGYNGWTIPSGQVDPPVLSDVHAKSGIYSMKTGNTYNESFSEFYQDVYIPAGAANATLQFHVYTKSEEVPAAAPDMNLLPSMPQEGDSWDSILAPETDVQYAYVMDTSNNVLKKLMWLPNSNTNSWTYKEFDLSAYKGQTVRLLFGTYNDGKDGKSTMWVDTVYLDACEVAPPACNKVINSDFEDGYNGWTIPSGQIDPPVLSDVHAKSGIYSMKTGNTYNESFSEFYQDVYIPAGAANATLQFHVYTKSEEVPAAAPDMNLLPSMPQEGDSWDSILAPETDVQYAYVMDTSNNVLKKLMWLPNSNTNSWTYLGFDLSAYKGQTVRLLFGTYNDGKDGKSTMWVDTVYLDACEVAPPSLIYLPLVFVMGGCNKVINSDFEDGYNGWTIPSGQVDPPVLSDVHAKSGIYSMKTGNTYNESFSEFYQDVYIPAGAANATLQFHVYTKSEEVPAAAPDMNLLPSMPQEGDSWDSILAPETDVQYAYVMDTSNNVLKKLMWLPNSNTNSWTYKEFDLSAYKGQTVRLLFGTYNDGKDGKSTMWVDTVYLDACEVAPPACNKVINSDFEDGYNGWTIPSGQIDPPVLSDVHAKSGIYSMKTGNTYNESFSEFYQDVYIPAGAANATLQFHVYTKSEEVPAAAPDMNLLPSMPQEGDSWDSILAPETDVQYAYVMDTSNNVLKKLMWLPNSNTNSWTYLEFDLSAYKGQTVRLLFGTYNDGKDGKSTMWVDTVYLDACAP